MHLSEWKFFLTNKKTVMRLGVSGMAGRRVAGISFKSLNWWNYGMYWYTEHSLKSFIKIPLEWWAGRTYRNFKWQVWSLPWSFFQIKKWQKKIFQKSLFLSLRCSILEKHLGHSKVRHCLRFVTKILTMMATLAMLLHSSRRSGLKAIGCRSRWNNQKNLKNRYLWDASSR